MTLSLCWPWACDCWPCRHAAQTPPGKQAQRGNLRRGLARTDLGLTVQLRKPAQDTGFSVWDVPSTEPVAGCRPLSVRLTSDTQPALAPRHSSQAQRIARCVWSNRPSLGPHSTCRAGGDQGRGGEMRPGMAAEGNATGRQKQRQLTWPASALATSAYLHLAFAGPHFVAVLGPRLGRCRAGEAEHGRVLVGCCSARGGGRL